MRRALLAAALLLLAAATAGCLGSSGDDAGDDPDPAVASDPGPRESRDDGNATADEEAGNGTSQDADGGNTTEPGNGTDAPNGTDSGPQQGDVITEEHITVGSPTTYVRSLTVATGQEGVDSFRWEADLPAGTVLATNTTANQGGPYNVDIYFHEANGSYLGGCNTPEDGDETCSVPEGAVQGTVDAAWGADLDVTLYVKAPP